MNIVKKLVLILLGWIFLIIGIIGVILPVMPGTIFLMISGLCFINSSKRLYRFLIKLKYIGPTIESYVERQEVTRKFKVSTLLFFLVPTVITQIFIVKYWVYRVISLLLLVVILGHIFSLKTVSEEKILENVDQIDDKF